ncbi:MAG: GNAT family N-acetyltransferase [Aeromicrobium erythreum]
MTSSVQDNPAASRFEIEIDGELAGYVDYRRDGDVYALPHTKVLPQFEGRGVGSELVLATLEQIRDRGGSVLPYCPFVPKVIRDHPELTDLVPADQREMFGV